MEFIAHRAGNTAEALLAAESIVDIIEVDVHLGRGNRVEVRHAKKLWLTARLWEKWYLEPRDTDIPALRDVVEAADPSTHLWLDLKGFTPRLSRRVREVMGERRPLTVSTKPWWLLTAFRGVPGIRTIRSAGNRFELALVFWLPSRLKTDGTVVHYRLLTNRVLKRLLQRGPVYTWAVVDMDSIERLRRGGVAGVILDDLRLVPPGEGT
jgi:glycerophosphoryl diester phosphodiesterase